MRTIFIGGPGRSGTSFVADRLANHADVSAIRDIELKLFTEKNGLLDLWHSMVERYSPNRAAVARQQFIRLTDALIEGQFGQPGLKTAAPGEAWRTVFRNFLNNAHPSGAFERTNTHLFRQASKQLVREVAQLSTSSGLIPRVFLEKTPHALLAPDFLAEIAPGTGFIHVMRDPRSIAHSLRGMRWGPDDLGDCCAWVSGYCTAWMDAQKIAAEQGLEIASFTIEGIAEKPEASADGICRAAGITSQPELFFGASMSILNGWVNTVAESDLNLLNRRLAGWVHHFGYSIEKIGCQKSVDRAEISDNCLIPETASKDGVVEEVL
ncbi:MAG: sulfotransferase [Pseudomonadota bacterium]